MTSLDDVIETALTSAGFHGRPAAQRMRLTSTLPEACRAFGLSFARTLVRCGLHEKAAKSAPRGELALTPHNTNAIATAAAVVGCPLDRVVEGVTLPKVDCEVVASVLAQFDSATKLPPVTAGWLARRWREIEREMAAQKKPGPIAVRDPEFARAAFEFLKYPASKGDLERPITITPFTEGAAARGSDHDYTLGYVICIAGTPPRFVMNVIGSAWWTEFATAPMVIVHPDGRHHVRWLDPSNTKSHWELRRAVVALLHKHGFESFR